MYVDDIIIETSDASLRHNLLLMLHKKFAMRDLGPLHYFLGIQVQKNKDSMFLSQSKYAQEILTRAGMETFKPIATPVDTKSKLPADSGAIFDNPALYRQLDGALQYLTFIRLDIEYAVQQVCLYMHDPRVQHFAALNRILHYLKGTLSFGLYLYLHNPTRLIVYTDADWGGCPSTRRSTSGYCVFLNGNLVC